MLKTMVAAFGVLLGASLIAAETTELTPVKDNTLYEDEEGRFSNGSGQYLFAGNTAKNFIRRGLVAFDVSAALPPRCYSRTHRADDAHVAEYIGDRGC